MPFTATSPCGSARSSVTSLLENDTGAGGLQGVSPPRRQSSPTDERRVDALWAEIQRDTRHNVRIKNTVEPNRSGYACVDNPHLISVKVQSNGPSIPIHGHRWQLAHDAPKSPNLSNSTHYKNSTTSAGYAAAQAPENDCTNLLIHGIDTGEGIFQFISPRSHQSGRSTQGPSIIQMIDRWKARATATPEIPLRLGDRYEVIGFDPVDGSHDGDDHVRYALTVRDLATAKESVVPITQVGLPFTDRVLQADDIVRANQVLNTHIEAHKKRHAIGEQVPSPVDPLEQHGPLIVSQAGIGRNAALITFRDISSRIVQDKSVNRDNLDAILRKVILDSRQARGPKFMHSKNQMKAVRQALLELIERTEKQPTHSPSPSMERSGRRLVSPPPSARERSPASQKPTDVAGLNTDDDTPASDSLPVQEAPSSSTANPASETSADTTANLQPEQTASSTTTTGEVAAQDQSEPVEEPPSPHESSTPAPVDPTLQSQSQRQSPTAATVPIRRTSVGRRLRRSVTNSVTNSARLATKSTREFFSAWTTDRVSTTSPAETSPSDSRDVFTQKNPMLARRLRERPPALQISDSNLDRRAVVASPPNMRRRRTSLASTGAMQMGDERKQVFHFTAPLLNMQMIDSRINQLTVGGSHRIKEISGANSDCWWRAGWLNALLQHSQKQMPASHLESVLIKKLGDDVSEDAKNITRMIEAMRVHGFAAVLTHMPHLTHQTQLPHQTRANQNADMEVPSRLMLPGEVNPDDDTQGEDVCRRLTEALLRHAGIPDVERLQSIHGKEPGDALLAAALCNELACDMVLYSKPWANTDHEAQAVWICPQPDSRLNALEIDEEKQDSLTKELINKVEQTPVFITRRGHFNLAIPTRFTTA